MIEPGVECTHCRVLMTSWTAPGGSVRYWQCPFCGRTHSSLYDEVFRAGAGARLASRPAATPGSSSAEERHWALLKARAARWFDRLAAEERGPVAPGPRS